MTIETFLCLRVSVRVNCAIVVSLRTYEIRKNTFIISEQKVHCIFKMSIEDEIALFHLKKL